MSVVRTISFGRFLMAMMVALSWGDWAAGGNCPSGVCGVPRAGFSSVRSSAPTSGGCPGGICGIPPAGFSSVRSSAPTSGGCPGGVCGVPRSGFSSVRSSAPTSGGCPGGVCGIPPSGFSPVRGASPAESGLSSGNSSSDPISQISQSIATEFNAGLSSLNPQYAAIVSGQVGQGGPGVTPAYTVSATNGTSRSPASAPAQFKNSNAVIDSQLNQMAKNGTLRDGMVVNDPVMRMGSSVVKNQEKFVQVGEGIYMRKADGAFFAKEGDKDRYQPVVGVGEGEYEGAADELTTDQKEFFEKLAKLQAKKKPEELEKILNEGPGAVDTAMAEQKKEEEKEKEKEEPFDPYSHGVRVLMGEEDLF